MHKETADEKWAFTICWVFGIDYMNLSEDNRITLACVFKKSSVLPAATSQQGKLEAAVPVWKEKAERMTQKELRFPPKRFVALLYCIS